MSHLNFTNSPQWFPSDEIIQLAIESEFQKRRSGKIDPVNFFNYVCLESIQGTVSYNDLAAKIQAETGIGASRQAYHQRMGSSCVAFFQKALSSAMGKKVNNIMNNFPLYNGTYKRILVQDSTVLRLPTRLFEIYSGVRNAHKSVCNARVQCVYDLISQEFIHFSIDSYSKNDLSVAYDIVAQPGDLIIRDRGYFIVGAMTQIKEQYEADSLFRYKHKTLFYDPESGDEINLLDYLSTHGSIDKVVLAVENKQHRVRLLAAPVPEEVANIRRMKAKKESSSKKPSEELLQLMSWSIYVTTIMDPAMTFSCIEQLYQLRWRIENIFKTWKSNFNFDRIHNVSSKQLEVQLLARLIMITITYKYLYRPLSRLVSKTTTKTLSLMKLMRYISKNIGALGRFINPDRINSNDLDAVVRYCTYDTRHRKTFEENFAQALAFL